MVQLRFQGAQIKCQALKLLFKRQIIFATNKHYNEDFKFCSIPNALHSEDENQKNLS